ncbi:MAG TPA: peptide deformylase [Cellulomonas sp.]
MSDPVREAALRLVEHAAGDPRGIVPIVRAGAAVLRAAAVPFDGQLADDELAALLDVMHRTLRAAPGVGLAAPQVGLPLTLAVVEDPLADPAREREPVPFRVLVNPRYEAVGDELVAFEEGCLSVPGYAAVVARHRRVRLVGHDEGGAALDEELVGWPARIVQHETDHLNGTLYVDKADLRTLAALAPVA